MSEAVKDAIPLAEFEKLLTKFKHNNKRMRFHRWYPNRNRFYLNNCCVVLVESDYEKRTGIVSIERRPRVPKVIIHLTSPMFEITRRKLEEFFKDKQSVYIDICSPYDVSYGISPFVDFLDTLLNGVGTCIEYSETFEACKSGERKYHIFSPEVFGLTEKEYLRQWEERMMILLEESGVFTPPAEEKKNKLLELEIEIFIPAITRHFKHYENWLKERLNEKLSNDKKTTVNFAIRPPVSKPYKGMSLLLTIFIEEKLEYIND